MADHCKDDEASAKFFQTYTTYKQGVPDEDPVRRFMRWSLRRILEIQAQVDSQGAECRDLRAKCRDLEAQAASGESRTRERLKELEAEFGGNANKVDFYLALHSDAILGVSSILSCMLFLLNIFGCRVRELSTAYWFAASRSLCKRPWRSV